MHARPILIVELPVPAGREEEWNKWYHEEHIADLLMSGVGAANSVRYRLIGGEDDVTVRTVLPVTRGKRVTYGARYRIKILDAVGYLRSPGNSAAARRRTTRSASRRQTAGARMVTP